MAKCKAITGSAVKGLTAKIKTGDLFTEQMCDKRMGDVLTTKTGAQF